LHRDTSIVLTVKICYHFCSAKRRGSILKMADGLQKEAVIAEEYAKATVRSLVEHPFHFIKNLFEYRKTRYRGLAKNESRFTFS